MVNYSIKLFNFRFINNYKIIIYYIYLIYNEHFCIIHKFVFPKKFFLFSFSFCFY